MTSGAFGASAGAWELGSLRSGGTVTTIVALPDGRLVAGASMGVHVSADGGRTWRPWNPATALPTVTALAWVDGKLHVACAAGLFRDGGDDAGWVPMLLGPVASVVGAGGGLLLSATPTDGVLRSQDGGATWQAASAGLRSLTVHGLALFEDGVSRIALAGTADGVYRSSGTMPAWRRVMQMPVDVVDVALAARSAYAPVAFALDATGALHRSIDGGETWSTEESGYALSAIGVDAEGGERLCAAAGRVLLESSDAGRTWQTLAILDEEVLAICPVPGDRAVVAGVLRLGVVRIVPGRGADRPAVGARLVGHARLLPERGILGLPLVITAGIDDGIATSSDGGRSWTEVMPSDGAAIVALDAGPRSGTVVAARTDRSVVGGLAEGPLAPLGWTAEGGVLALSVEDRIGGAIALVTDHGTVQYTNGDGDWQEVMRASGDAEIVGVDVGHRSGDLVVATRVRADEGARGLIWATRDGGDNWRLVLELQEPGDGPALLEADRARIVIGWGRRLTGVRWPDDYGGAPDAAPPKMDGEYTITAMACQPVGGRTHALVGTTAGLVSVLIDDLHATVLDVDLTAPSPAIAVAANPGGFDPGSEAWAVDLHGQLWHRLARGRETTQARAQRAERLEAQTA